MHLSQCITLRSLRRIGSICNLVLNKYTRQERVKNFRLSFSIGLLQKKMNGAQVTEGLFTNGPPITDRTFT